MTMTNGTTVQSHTALAVRQNDSIEPSNMTELRALAKDAADSGFYGAKNAAQAMMILMTGRDLGFSYSQALRAFHVIKEKVSITADGAVAVCLARPDLCEYFDAVEESATSCTWRTKRVGRPEKRETFTMDDAAKADLLKQNEAMYRKYPKRMLSARAKMFLARDVYPELILGLLSHEEADDIAAERATRRAPVEPARVVPAVVADAEFTQVEDPSIAESERLETLINEAPTLEDRDAVVKEVVKAFKAKRINQIQYDGLAHTAAERKKALAGAA